MLDEERDLKADHPRGGHQGPNGLAKHLQIPGGDRGFHSLRDPDPPGFPADTDCAAVGRSTTELGQIQRSLPGLLSVQVDLPERRRLPECVDNEPNQRRPLPGLPFEFVVDGWMEAENLLRIPRPLRNRRDAAGDEISLCVRSGERPCAVPDLNGCHRLLRLRGEFLLLSLSVSLFALPLLARPALVTFQLLFVGDLAPLLDPEKVLCEPEGICPVRL